MSESRVRYMRMIVFFDLPMETAVQRRNYARFRKYLLKSGFLMMQKSVYSKLAINDKVYAGILNRLRENRPPDGMVQALKVTEKQFASIANVVGEVAETEELADTESLVVL